MLELYVSFVNRLTAIKDEERGQAMAEYGIILALIAAVCIALFVTLGGQIADALTTVTDQL